MADGRRAPVRLARLRPAALIALTLALPGAAGAGGFTSGQRDGRAYRLFVPAGAPAGPLLVALHGCWQTPEDFARGSRLNEAAERRRLVVVYPAQSRHDNPSRCWNWFAPANLTAGGDETGALLGLARTVQAAHRLAEPRLVVLGFSAGAFMAVNLACAAPDVVAGLGVSAGGPYRCGVGPMAAIQCMRGAAEDGRAAAAACRTAGGGRPPALRASLWHGDGDAVVHAANLDALRAMLTELLSAATPSAGTAGGARRTVLHRAGVPVLETWLVHGMGHAWSGGDPRGTHTYPPGPDATERMLDFLLPLAPAPAR